MDDGNGWAAEEGGKRGPPMSGRPPGKNESGRSLAEEEVTNDPANKGIQVGGVKPIILGRSGRGTGPVVTEGVDPSGARLEEL